MENLLHYPHLPQNQTLLADFKSITDLLFWIEINFIKNNICVYPSFLLWFHSSLTPKRTKAIYNINFISNLDTKAIRTERALLIIDNNQNSSCTTENTYKQDSIRRLVKEGVLTAQEVMNDKYPKTGLNHFVQKNYSEQSMTIANLIASDNYIYT